MAFSPPGKLAVKPLAGGFAGISRFLSSPRSLNSITWAVLQDELDNLMSKLLAPVLWLFILPKPAELDRFEPGACNALSLTESRGRGRAT